MTPDKTPGQLIRAAREAKGLPREKLSRMIDCSTAAVVRWERDVSQPRLDYACKLSEILGIEVKAFIPHR